MERCPVGPEHKKTHVLPTSVARTLSTTPHHGIQGVFIHGFPHDAQHGMCVRGPHVLLENHEFCVHGLVWGYRGVGMRGRKFEVCLCIRHGACSDMHV